MFILGAIWFLGSRAYWQFVVADVLYGIGLAWQSGADIALLAPGGARAFAQYRAVGSAAGMAASLVAGAVLETRGMHALVVLNVAMAVLAGAAIVTFRGDSPRRTVATTRPQVSARAAWAAFRRAPRLVAWMVAGAVVFRLVDINLFFLDLPLWAVRGFPGVNVGVGVALLYGAGWASLLAPKMQRRFGSRPPSP